MDSLGDRMKEYEGVAKTRLVKRIPVAIRVDGRAFHTFTKGFVKPFDNILSYCMGETMKYLCENVQNCVLGYTQSDEITLILCDYKTINSQAYFDNEVQKLCSIVSSMATMKFNKTFAERIGESLAKNSNELTPAHTAALDKGAMFDARCFNIPQNEVTNLLIWRQQDATRNSIEMVGRHYFSAKELHKVNCNEIQEKLFAEKGVNWNDTPTKYKRGFCCVRYDVLIKHDDNAKNRIKGVWTMDYEIPIFTQDRDYIESRIKFD